MMNVLKHPSFFRPTSRPSSPAPAIAPLPTLDTQAPERHARSLNKLALGSFRRPSPSPYPPANAVSMPLVQDGSYLEMLSLKLSEAISRALAQPTGPATVNEQLAGRRPIPQGRGHALGALIASELASAQENPHLYRAILRSLHRPLSVLLTNLSAHLLPLLTSPSLRAPPTVQAPNPNPTQVHALAISQFSEELLEVFDEFNLGKDNDIRGDGLRAIREGLISFVNKVTTPVIGEIRNQLMSLIESLETPNGGFGAKPAAGTKTVVALHPSIVALQAIVPIYARSLARYTTFTWSHSTLATLLICIVWKGLIAISHRPDAHVSASAILPPSLTVKKRRGSPTSTPPLTPPGSRFAIKLPPSRPPSPPATIILATAADDARALYEILNLLPRPSDAKDSTRVAREAIDEAFEGLRALPPLLNAVYNKNVSHNIDDVAQKLEVLTTEMPSLIALPILLRSYADPQTPSVSEILGLSDSEYRQGCLSGFGRAEECTTVVARRMIEVLGQNPTNKVVVRWLEMEIEEIEGGD